MEKPFRPKILWSVVFILTSLHLTALYGFYLLLTTVSWSTTGFVLLLYVLSGLGVTAGAHRLWSHRSYKAKLPLRIFLAIFQTVSCQRDIFEWCKDHRVHHKFSETDADPHNIQRGFFFSHIGWIMCEKHPQVMEKYKTVDYSDLLQDPVVYYQRKFYEPLVIVLCFILPTVIPYWFWDESLWNSFFVCTLFRLCFSLNVAFSVNSISHIWGNKPYDKNIMSTENKGVSFFAIGEGFHNYHHTFPWDYSTSEFGWKINFTTLFIDFCAFLGLAYDRKSASKEIISQVKNKNLSQRSCSTKN